jgi:SAM-dependent methyltransferase
MVSNNKSVSSDFFTPESMARQAEEAEGVYSGYKSFAEGGGREGISYHAVIDDEYARAYVDNILPSLKRRGLPGQGAVMDAGCGPGTITSAFGQALGSETVGIDLSTPIISAAARHYAGIDYRVCSADSPSFWPDHHFRLIHCREFYPFTRTSDLDLYRRFLAAWLPKLAPGGIAAAVQVVTQDCMERVWPQTQALARDLGYVASGRDTVVPLRLFRRFGGAVNRAPLYPVLASALNGYEALRPRSISLIYWFRAP